MIPLLGVQQVTRLRFGAPTVVEHQPIRPEPESASIYATIAPASKRTMERAPNGIAVEDLVDIATYSEVRAAEEGGHLADRLVIDGTTYEVQWVTRQPPFAGQPAHFEAAALRLGALDFAEPEAA